MDEMVEYTPEHIGAICEDLRNIAIKNKRDLLAYILQMIVEESRASQAALSKKQLNFWDRN